MAYGTVLAQTATNKADLFTQLKTFLLARGWTLHDDLETIGSYNVYKSTGESGTENIFIYVDKLTAAKLFFRTYGDWDASAHTGTKAASGTVTVSFVTTVDAGPHLYWFYGDKDSVAVVTRIVSTYNVMIFGIPVRTYSSSMATLQSNVTSGSNIVLQLAAGETALFTVNEYYMLSDKNYTSRVLVNAKDAGANTVTVTTLATNFLADAKLGEDPQPSFVGASTVGSTVGLYFTNWYSGWAAEATQIGYSVLGIDSSFLTNSYASPRYINRRFLFSLFTVISNATNKEVRGTIKNVYAVNAGDASEDTITIGGVVHDLFVAGYTLALPRTV